MSYSAEQIVHQLRSLAHPNGHASDYAKARMLEAADVIERQQKLLRQCDEYLQLCGDTIREQAGILAKCLQQLEPHAYVPSAMGNCQLCGHLQGDAIHDRRTA